MTYLLLYLLVKLNDFKEVLANTYGFTVTIALICLVYLFISTGKRKKEDGTRKNYDPFSAVFEPYNNYKLKLCRKVILISFIVQLLCNITVALLPSTGQIAVIYLGGKGLQSDTLKEVTSMDPKFASFIKRESDKWLSEQINDAKKVIIKEVTN